MAQRNLYNQPTPPVAPAPIPQAKPAQAQSPYGGAPYPSSAYDDQSSFGSAGVGRFGDSKAPVQSTQNQYAHTYLGVGQQNAARQQATTPDEGFKSATPQSSASVGAAVPAQGQQTPGQAQGLRGPQGFGAGAGAGYPYGQYQAQGQQDWSQYGQQQYGGSRNGYSGGWQQ
jgi:hypothetical protein